ncbi:MAG TPA: CARDB domain-containing protein [Burkholderiales bacterium]|nr:CARDB domain-containing protein [Burkholderiales bacterium]
MSTRVLFRRGAVALYVVAAWITVFGPVHADGKFGTPLPGQPLPNPKNLRVVKPDLIVVSIVPGAAPRRPAIITVRNVGDGPAGATNIKISCADRRAPGSSSNCQYGTISADVGALTPGAQVAVTADTGVLGKAGSPLVNSTVRGCLDSSNRISESNETNNCGQGNW